MIASTVRSAWHITRHHQARDYFTKHIALSTSTIVHLWHQFFSCGTGPLIRNDDGDEKKESFWEHFQRDDSLRQVSHYYFLSRKSKLRDTIGTYFTPHNNTVFNPPQTSIENNCRPNTAECLLAFFCQQWS